MTELIIGMALGALGFGVVAAISKNKDRQSALQMKDLRASGRPLDQVAQDDGFSHDPAEVMGLIRSGNKIEAIKAVREMTGLGLKEAKDLVDKMSRGDYSALEAKTPKGGGL